MGSEFFWTMTIIIFLLQLVNQYCYGNHLYEIQYPLNIATYSAILVLETALAFNSPEQIAILLFDLINAWVIYNSIKGFLHLKKKKILNKSIYQNVQ